MFDHRIPLRFSILTSISILALWGLIPVTPAQEATMEDRCRQEVVELHQFFTQWFNGELTNDDASFARLAKALGPDFEIIGPDAHRLGQEAVLGAIRSGHGGRAEGGFAIEVKNVQSRSVGGGLVLVTYEEHQTRAGQVRAWQSSALFRDLPGNPNDVQWIHVQETYLPGLGGS